MFLGMHSGFGGFRGVDGSDVICTRRTFGGLCWG